MRREANAANLNGDIRESLIIEESSGLKSFWGIEAHTWRGGLTLIFRGGTPLISRFKSTSNGVIVSCARLELGPVACSCGFISLAIW